MLKRLFLFKLSFIWIFFNDTCKAYSLRKTNCKAITLLYINSIRNYYLSLEMFNDVNIVIQALSFIFNYPLPNSKTMQTLIVNIW